MPRIPIPNLLLLINIDFTTRANYSPFHRRRHTEYSKNL